MDPGVVEHEQVPRLQKFGEISHDLMTTGASRAVVDEHPRLVTWLDRTGCDQLRRQIERELGDTHSRVIPLDAARRHDERVDGAPARRFADGGEEAEPAPVSATSDRGQTADRCRRRSARRRRAALGSGAVRAAGAGSERSRASTNTRSAPSDDVGRAAAGANERRGNGSAVAQAPSVSTTRIANFVLMVLSC